MHVTLVHDNFDKRTIMTMLRGRYGMLGKCGLGCMLLLLASVAVSKAVEPKPGKSYRIFDGKTLKGWKITDFGGQGEVEVEKGRILLPVGQDMTGITWDEKSPPQKLSLPKENYELSLEAMRVDGADFFCGITFPVGDEPCSLILGGWGGGVVGLSSINGQDASENETTQYVEFENKRWYKIRLRVTKEKISVWIDDKEVIETKRADKEFGIRFEVDLSRPLGFATWQTVGALRNINLTVLQPAEEEDERSPSDRPVDVPVEQPEPSSAPGPIAESSPVPSDEADTGETPPAPPQVTCAAVNSVPCCQPSKRFRWGWRRCR